MLNLRGHDLLTLRDLSSDEILEIIRLANRLKHEDRGKHRDILSGKKLAMIFQKPSTRTRVSFEAAMTDLGGRALYLGWNDLQLGRGETIADTARVLSRYVDGIMARVFSFRDIQELASHASVPVINGLTDINHPMQTLADLLTIWEKRGSFNGVKIAWIGDGNNVCNSLLVGCSKLGISVDVACPEGYEPNEDYLRAARLEASKTNCAISVMREPKEAVEDADIVYTDVFVSMGQEAEAIKRKRNFLPKYQVNATLLENCKKDFIFMHDLPAHRGEEVTDEVIDSPRSVVWDQAENRLHTAKAILMLLL